jgi:hypothetical protein
LRLSFAFFLVAAALFSRTHYVTKVNGRVWRRGTYTYVEGALAAAGQAARAGHRVILVVLLIARYASSRSIAGDARLATLVAAGELRPASHRNLLHHVCLTPYCQLPLPSFWRERLVVWWIWRRKRVAGLQVSITMSRCLRMEIRDSIPPNAKCNRSDAPPRRFHLNAGPF